MDRSLRRKCRLVNPTWRWGMPCRSRTQATPLRGLSRLGKSHLYKPPYYLLGRYFVVKSSSWTSSKKVLTTTYFRAFSARPTRLPALRRDNSARFLSSCWATYFSPWYLVRDQGVYAMLNQRQSWHSTKVWERATIINRN